MSVGCGGEIFALVSQSQIQRLSNADDPKAHVFEPYEASEATAERLWQELSQPSWQRRSRAHLEMSRRGGELLKQANKRLLTTKEHDPALPHLIWLAAKSQQGSLHLLGLVDHPNAKLRIQAIRALAEFPEQLREEPIFTKAIIDKDAHVRLAAVTAYFHPKVVFDSAVHKAIERGPACEADPRLRQLAAMLLAREATLKQIDDLCGRADPALREAGARIAGYRLTLLQSAPAGQLGEVPFVAKYADGDVDLRTRGRLGTFTLASHWKADMHTVEQELLFKLLVRLLADEESAVRMQAAIFLSELRDARCDAAVRKVLKQ
jgi:hypothetical protein